MTENLPHDELIEQSVLGTILKFGIDALIEVVGDLDEAYFYEGFHQNVYRIIIDLFYNSEPIDEKTVASKVGESVTDLLQEAVDLESLPGYVEALKRFYIRRFIIVTGNEMAFLGLNDKESTAGDLLNEATAMVLTSDILDAGGGFKSAKEAASVAKERIEKLRNSPGLPGISTGINDLDFLIGGLQGGDLVIIAGRPGTGKTSLMVGIAKYAAMDGMKVGIFSYEMEANKLIDRMAAELANLNLQYLRTAQIPEDKIEPLYAAYDYLAELPISIDDTGKGNIGYVIGKTKQLALQKKLDMLCVDYLQLIPAHRRDNRNVILGEMTQRLKNLAMELGIPILLLSQLNRAVEGRDDHRPILSDLRESGNLEQDADMVIFIFREEMYNWTEANSGKAELIIAKNRHGPINIVKVEFIKETAHFTVLEAWNVG